MTETKPDPHILNRKKKRRKIILTILLLVLVVFALSILKIVLIFTGEPKITIDYVAQWERISKPSDYDPNQNAFFDYQKAIETVTRAPDAINFAPSTLWPEDMNDAHIQILRKWLEENGEAMNHLKSGSIKPYCWIKDSYVDNYLGNSTRLDFGYFRELAWPINWQAKLDASEGRTNDAIENLLAGYRLTSHIMGSKPILYHLVAWAIREMTIHTTWLVLERGELDSQALQYFQEQLQELFDTKNSELDFRHEKLVVLDAIQRVFTDDGKGNGRLLPYNDTTMVFVSLAVKYGANPSQPREKFLGLRNHAYATWLATAGPDKRDSVAMTEKFYDHIEALKDKSFWQMRNEEAQSIETMKTTIEDYVVLFCGEYAYSMLERYQRFRAQQNALITTLAILRYKQDKETLPENLQQLVDTGFLNELPMDPFGPGPLSYKVTGQDLILYSFGHDCDDDGGKRSTWGKDQDGGGPGLLARQGRPQQ